MNIRLDVINRAIKEAKSSNVTRGKVGSVLFEDNGHIICSSHNQIFRGYVDKHKFTIHAEEHLILQKANKLKILERCGHKRLNVLVLRYKQGLDILGNAKPCPRCEYILRRANVNVYYTNEQGCIVKLQK